MSSSYEFWIPSNQNTSSSALTTTGPGGVEYIGDPEHLSNSNELVFGNAIKTQMGSTVNSYLGVYVANYTPYYMATIAGFYQQTILGVKSEFVYGYKMEYKGTGKIEYNNATELSQKIGLTTLIHSAYTAVASVFSSTTEEAREEIVGGDFGVTVVGVMTEEITERSTEGVSETKTLEESETDVASSQKVYGDFLMAADTVTLSCPEICFSSAVIILG